MTEPRWFVCVRDMLSCYYYFQPSFLCIYSQPCDFQSVPFEPHHMTLINSNQMYISVKLIAFIPFIAGS